MQVWKLLEDTVHKVISLPEYTQCHIANRIQRSSTKAAPRPSVVLWPQCCLAPCYSNMVHRPGAFEPLKTLLEMQNLELLGRPTKLGSAFEQDSKVISMQNMFLEA